MKRLVAATVGLSALLTTGLAAAQTSVETRDYRRADRPSFASPQNFAFELRFGPYVPEIDEEFPASKPYERVFGTGKGFHFGFEIDWQALRIPYFGTLGPGVGWSYSRRSANAKLSSSGLDSAESTSLTIMPMHLSAVLRVDVLAREIGIPIVPYGKAGLGMGLWTTATESGTSERDGVLGRGKSFGTHVAGGGMFLLDIIDPASALAFDEEIGVNNSYIFFEWQWANLDGLSFISKDPQMHVGTSNWVLGLALEF